MEDDPDLAEQRFWRWPLALLLAAAVAIIGWMIAEQYLQKPDRMDDVEKMPKTHPVFGTVYLTSATDVMELPQARDARGNLLPREPVCLMLGTNKMEWGAADIHPGRQSGYLYFWSFFSGGTNLWAVAPCSKQTLEDVTARDLEAEFIPANQNDKGRAVFGANWLGSAVRGNAAAARGVQVKEGQVVLLRKANDPSTIYVVEMTRQNRGNLKVRYLEIHK